MQAIILRAIAFKERDLILQILSNELGKISVFAPRQRSSGKQGQSRLEVFDSGKIELGPRHGELYTLKHFKPISSFPHIRDSLNKLTLGSFICEATSLILADENESDSALYHELEHALHEISSVGDLKLALRVSQAYLLSLLTHSGLVEAEKYNMASLNTLQKLIGIAEQHAEHRFQSRTGLEQVFKLLKATA